MLTLGIADGQTSGACVVSDGRILSAINEERIVRLKQARGFPRDSIAEALRLAGADPSDIDDVAVADLRMSLRERIDSWPGWFEARAEGRGGVDDRFFRLASRFGGLVPYAPGLRVAHNALQLPRYAGRRRRVREIVRDEFGVRAPLEFWHHHLAHATAAYHSSGFQDALVVTMDGGGDGHCSHVYSVNGGRFERLASIDSYHSLGNYYAYVTAICGYKAKRHEGKITGLAAHGEPVYRELFESLIGCEGGRLRNRGRVLFDSALEKIRGHLPPDWSHEDLASTIQTVAEDVATAFVGYWARRTGHRRVAVAGGVFANVRINEEVLRRSHVDEIFVHPGMGDEGLAVGAALGSSHAAARRQGRPIEPEVLGHVYLGTDIDEAACESALDAAGVEFTRPDDVPAHAARLLADGHVVARAAGRMEYGPRALGNRTIMYRPDDPSVNDWLNQLLRRTEFMPFAPASLESHTDELYLDADGARETARFMTITLSCTERMKQGGSGVVHVDGTARPQIVRAEDNPEFHAIIEEFHALTGFPAIINTSFNIHEEPIVRSAEDAVRAFVDSRLDYLLLGPFIARGPVGSAEARARWAAAQAAPV